MTADKLQTVMTLYKKTLIGVPSIRNGTALQHVNWMLDNMCDNLPTLDMEKAARWLGFIQGVLWVSNVFTIDEMRDHNRE